jgi:hypothetical protein
MSGSGNKSSEWDSLVWIAVIALVGFFVYIAIPNFIKSRSTSAQNACVNNLRQIDGAKNEWALENGKTNGVVCTVEDIKPYIKLNAKGDIPGCPQGGIYTIGKVGENPTCSLGTTVTSAHVLP